LKSNYRIEIKILSNLTKFLNILECYEYNKKDLTNSFDLIGLSQNLNFEFNLESNLIKILNLNQVYLV
jgi:hypothetical protein